MKKSKTPGNFQDAGAKALRANFQKIEHREWWLWVAAAIITLLLTVALASFLLPNPATNRGLLRPFRTPLGGVAVSWACEVFGATLQKANLRVRIVVANSLGAEC